MFLDTSSPVLTLSPLPDPSGVAPNNQADEEMLVIVQVVGPGNLTLDHVRTASRDDPELVSLRHALSFGFPPRFKKCKGILKPFYSLQHELSVSGDLVVRAGC